MRRAWSRILVAAPIIGLVGIYPLLAPTPHRIDPAHFDLIVKGMSKDQVEAIFGVPAGQYDWAEDNGHAHYRLHFHLIQSVRQARPTGGDDLESEMMYKIFREVHSRGPQTELTWTSRHGSLAAWFDQDDRVVSTHVSTEVRVTPPWQRWWSRYWKK
jgi:hypothetical protein